MSFKIRIIITYRGLTLFNRSFQFPVHQRQFSELTQRLNKTAIFVTHDVREALIVGSHIGLMHHGKLLLLETPENFLKSTNERALAYLETLNLAPAGSRPMEASK